MPETAAGWSYSMRVLLPALALGSALAGWIGAAGRRLRLVAAVLVGLLSLDAARRSWLLPDFPFETPWTFSLDVWRFARAQNATLARRNIWPVLAGIAGGKYIVVDNPQPFVATIAAGGHPTTLTSPRIAAMFDPSLSVQEAVQRLRALNVRFVTFSTGNPVVNRLVQRHRVFRELAEDYSPVTDLKGFMIFDLEFLTLKHPGAGTPRPAIVR
jgi:hypothetical protein